MEQDSVDPKLEIQMDRDNLEGFEIQFDSVSLHANRRNNSSHSHSRWKRERNSPGTDIGTYT